MASTPNGADSEHDDSDSRLFKRLGMAIVIEVLAGLVIGFFAFTFDTEDKPLYEPPTAAQTPDAAPSSADTSWSPSPYEPATDEPTDPVATARVGDCFENAGVADDFDLEPSGCDPGAFEVVEVFDGGDVHDCDGVTGSVFGHDPGYGSVLCLHYLHPWGDAYYAAPGDCVTRADDDTYRVTDCDPGDYLVLERFWGEREADRCSEWEYYNGAVEFPGYIAEQDLLLCMRMEYPDDMAFARVDDCMYASGEEGDRTFEFADCSESNVYVTGHTPDYDAQAFCDGYGWATWRSSVFPEYAYTVCWAWL
ncbi:hypothetical protein GCM10009830_40830 [Glycomyces endophyticus]|uniref:Septum formation-related domain-containing protein n=1 Tax=Glycomyces endophyticus TaxID=480996 RepID=A0ABP4TJJ2_9ACTN